MGHGAGKCLHFGCRLRDSCGDAAHLGFELACHFLSRLLAFQSGPIRDILLLLVEPLDLDAVFPEHIECARHGTDFVTALQEGNSNPELALCHADHALLDLLQRLHYSLSLQPGRERCHKESE